MWLYSLRHCGHRHRCESSQFFEVPVEICFFFTFTIWQKNSKLTDCIRTHFLSSPSTWWFWADDFFTSFYAFRGLCRCAFLVKVALLRISWKDLILQLEWNSIKVGTKTKVNVQLFSFRFENSSWPQAMYRTWTKSDVFLLIWERKEEVVSTWPKES